MLQFSQRFTNDASTASTVFNAPIIDGTAIVNTTSAKETNLVLSYSAPEISYIIAAGNLTQTFLPEDFQTETTRSDKNYRPFAYQKNIAAGNDRLYFLRDTYFRSEDIGYVGGGYWRRSVGNGSSSNLNLTAFTYGINTPAARLRSGGVVIYRVEVSGIVSRRDETERQAIFALVLEIDFATGTFRGSSGRTFDNRERNSFTGNDIVRNLLFEANGTINKTDGTINGSFVYEGPNRRHIGTLKGRFYGPNGQQIGATLLGSDTGSSLVGTVVGKSIDR